MRQCITDNGIHVVSTSQPSDRYWLFQGVESALFVDLAIALVTFSIWWVRRRLRYESPFLFAARNNLSEADGPAERAPPHPGL
jgi:hypothetical protein